MVRTWLLALFVAGCGSFGTTQNTDTPADAAPTEGAPGDAAVDGGEEPLSIPPLESCAPPGFCEDFENGFPTPGWVGPNVVGGQASASYGIVAGQAGGKALEVSALGTGNQVITQRVLRATRAIRCEHDFLLFNWAEQANFFGVAFDSRQHTWDKWFDSWGTQGGIFSLFHLVATTSEKWEEYPKSVAPNPGGWRHLRYALDLGKKPRFSVTIEGTDSRTLTVDQKAAPTNGEPIDFMVRFGVFDVKGTTDYKILVDNIRCQAI